MEKKTQRMKWQRINNRKIYKKYKYIIDIKWLFYSLINSLIHKTIFYILNNLLYIQQFVTYNTILLYIKKKTLL